MAANNGSLRREEVALHLEYIQEEALYAVTTGTARRHYPEIPYSDSDSSDAGTPEDAVWWTHRRNYCLEFVGWKCRSELG